MESLEQKTIQFNSLVQATYLLRKGAPGGRLVILNHGFMSTNQRMWDRFVHRLPKEVSLLAPNGPYPLPTRQEVGWKVGYSWFFYDDTRETFLIGYDIPKDFIKNLIQALGFGKHKKTIIGFSQGGYAAVHMAEALEGVDHVIGIGCQFKIQKPQWANGLKIDALHGENDDIVSLSGAKNFFEKLPDHNKGRFNTFPDIGHKPSDEMLDLASAWTIENI